MQAFKDVAGTIPAQVGDKVALLVPGVETLKDVYAAFATQPIVQRQPTLEKR